MRVCTSKIRPCGCWVHALRQPAELQASSASAAFQSVHTARSKCLLRPLVCRDELARRPTFGGELARHLHQHPLPRLDVQARQHVWHAPRGSCPHLHLGCSREGGEGVESSLAHESQKVDLMSAKSMSRASTGVRPGSTARRELRPAILRTVGGGACQHVGSRPARARAGSLLSQQYWLSHTLFHHLLQLLVDARLVLKEGRVPHVRMAQRAQRVVHAIEDEGGRHACRRVKQAGRSKAGSSAARNIFAGLQGAACAAGRFVVASAVTPHMCPPCACCHLPQTSPWSCPPKNNSPRAASRLRIPPWLSSYARRSTPASFQRSAPRSSWLRLPAAARSSARKPAASSGLKLPTAGIGEVAGVAGGVTQGWSCQACHGLL